MTNLNLRTAASPTITLPIDPKRAHRQALERLYERKQILEDLIETLEAYARARAGAPVTTLPLRGN